jgi:Enoyl-CoA hydratase/isomerase
MVTAGQPLLDERGQIVEPLLIVDLDSAGHPPAGVGDRIVVGVTAKPLDQARRSVADALDLSLVPAGIAAGPQCVAAADPWAEAESLRAAAEASPQAALTLAAVLRAGLADITAALDLESFAYSALLGGRQFARWLEHRGKRRETVPSPRPAVLVQRSGSELRITLNRPERRNAYSREMRDALVEALRLATLDESIEQGVLGGAGLSFSAGGDLDEFGTAPDLATAHFVRTRAGAARLMHQLAGRLRVHVHGSCVGAGIELPAFAGRVLARPDTTFRFPEVTMGLIPGAGGTVSIPRRIGR